MNYETNFSLKNYNTFGLQANAKEFVTINTIDELIVALETKPDIFILGGGSNMLLTKDIHKTVLHINLKGIDVVEIDENWVEVTAMAGENWHEFVLWCIDQNYGGLENLSLIPGNVGSCPIQNIGAYGVEVKDTISKVTAIDKKSLKTIDFSNETCQFAYRDSIFKSKVKDQYVITAVTFKLKKQAHILQTTYGAIATELENISHPTIKDVSNAVINIRNSKLPNPKEIGNSGSFFKNPVISLDLFEEIKSNYPTIPSFPINETSIKVPAGWLIETAGFKGFRKGDAGVHTKQALVLVNYGNATGQEVYELAQEIISKIDELFKIKLEIEVNVL